MPQLPLDLRKQTTGIGIFHNFSEDQADFVAFPELDGVGYEDYCKTVPSFSVSVRDSRQYFNWAAWLRENGQRSSHPWQWRPMEKNVKPPIHVTKEEEATDSTDEVNNKVDEGEQLAAETFAQSVIVCGYEPTPCHHSAEVASEDDTDSCCSTVLPESPVSRTTTRNDEVRCAMVEATSSPSVVLLLPEHTTGLSRKKHQLCYKLIPGVGDETEGFPKKQKTEPKECDKEHGLNKMEWTSSAICSVG